MCDQQKLRPVCNYAQSDRSLCLSLEYSMTVKLLTEQHLAFLSLTGGCEARLSLFSTLDKQRTCVNTQFKSSKKQLKLNVCVPKSYSRDLYAITCDVIAYHLVHFLSIWVINKCQSGIDFLLLASAQYNSSL